MSIRCTARDYVQSSLGQNGKRRRRGWPGRFVPTVTSAFSVVRESSVLCAIEKRASEDSDIDGFFGRLRLVQTSTHTDTYAPSRLNVGIHERKEEKCLEYMK
jgi:hypothetical protein